MILKIYLISTLLFYTLVVFGKDSDRLSIADLTYSDRTGLFLLNALRVDPLAYFGNYGQDIDLSSSCVGKTVRDPNLKPLIWDPDLQKASNFHATSMKKTGHFDHETEPSECSNRFKGDCKMLTRVSAFVDMEGREVAENIHMYEGDANAFEAMRAFLESQEHCETMIDPKYKSASVARDGSYWTQNFLSTPSQSSIQNSESSRILVGTHVKSNGGEHVEFKLIYMYQEPVKSAKLSFLAVDGTKQERPLQIIYGNDMVAVWSVSVPASELSNCGYYYFQVTDPAPAIRYPAGKGVLFTYGINGCKHNFGELTKQPDSADNNEATVMFEKRDNTGVHYANVLRSNSASMTTANSNIETFNTLDNSRVAMPGATTLSANVPVVTDLSKLSSTNSGITSISLGPVNEETVVASGLGAAPGLGTSKIVSSNATLSHTKVNATTPIVANRTAVVLPASDEDDVLVDNVRTNMMNNMAIVGNLDSTKITKSIPLTSTIPKVTSEPIITSAPITDTNANVSEDEENRRILHVLIGTFIPIILFVLYLIYRLKMSSSTQSDINKHKFANYDISAKHSRNTYSTSIK